MYQEIRSNVVDRLVKAAGNKHALCLLEGGHQTTRYEAGKHRPLSDLCVDTDILFRQDSKFHYLFGVKEPDFYGVIETETKKAILFIPRLPESFAVWMGPIQTPEYYKDLYKVDEVLFTDDLPAYFEKFAPEVVHVTYGENTDSGSFAVPAKFEGLEKYNVEKAFLFNAITESRVFKTPKEMEIYRYVAKIGSQAHLDNMRAIEPEMYESQIESVFRHSNYFKGGCRELSFIPICASGRNSSILHYGHAGAPNDRQMHDGEWLLMDMGSEYKCYACDITTTCPVNGKFNDKQRFIYETVLDMNRQCQKMMKPGVNWVDVHTMSNRVMVQHFLKQGLFVGDEEEILQSNVAGYFMPHGLGHMMGIDVHDVGGYLEGMKRDTKMGYKSLRTRRDLEEGMLITVEPGVYFVDCCMDMVKKDETMNKFVNWEKVMEYYPLGGCRIECDVYITKDGCEDISCAPRTVEDVEKAYSGEITSVDQIKSFL